MGLNEDQYYALLHYINVMVTEMIAEEGRFYPSSSLADAADKKLKEVLLEVEGDDA